MSRFTSSNWETMTQSDRRSTTRHLIREQMRQCRAVTLKLFSEIDASLLSQQAHPDFSPIGWHLGHIAYTEALWLLQQSAGQPPIFPEYHRLFAADGLPKSQRGQLPSRSELLDYLEIVRTQTLAYLEIAPLETQERLWRWLIQHESQHCETVAFILALIQHPTTTKRLPPLSTPDPTPEMVFIPDGEFIMGLDTIDALDNERAAHPVVLDSYWIDRYPVTCGQYRAFLTADGYHNPVWWSEAGWQWLQAHAIDRPLYWHDDPAWDSHPVCGVSWYEADAYARFVGKRLPTEAEWEKAAGWDRQRQQAHLYPWGDTWPDPLVCNHQFHHGTTTPVTAFPEGQSSFGCEDMLGNVWEWTNSWFEGYPGFTSYPYRGYSQAYFDRAHRVLKGGSWATNTWAMRCSFRNWYHPHVRQILAGFRCAQSANV